jgi:ABC-type nitrate/sulfonate/bicarbonate transport system ATPase subunit
MPEPDDNDPRHEADDVAVSFADVSFSYENGVTALEGVDLAIGRGKSIGIIGPSGCGKTTLLYMLAGLRKPTSGRIDWAPIPPGRHPLAMVFQKDSVLPWLTVRQNVGLYFKYNRTGIDKKESRAWVEHLIQLAGLDGFENAYPYELSGGMRRRVAFLTGVASKPSTLLLDEPFSSLDEPTRIAIHQDVLGITREMRITLVLVTHDLAEAISLCDEVVILTNRPGHVFSKYDVPFGPERDLLALRENEEFLELYGHLWHDLSNQIRGRKSSPDLVPTVSPDA